ncbi:MAG: desulfoferrodoxin Dfx [Solobacterium sp.]|nr:desulfoferrodoxin Dfx [Solobacterium sp.]
MHEFKIYRCAKCGKTVAMLKKSGCPTMCCGEPMEELVPNTVEASEEKHIPAVTREGNKLSVQVGTEEHPMLPEHHIAFIALETEKGFRIVYLEPGEKPVADFLNEEKVNAVYAYCNLHGLWKTKA